MLVYIKLFSYFTSTFLSPWWRFLFSVYNLNFCPICWLLFFSFIAELRFKRFCLLFISFVLLKRLNFEPDWNLFVRLMSWEDSTNELAKNEPVFYFVSIFLYFCILLIELWCCDFDFNKFILFYVSIFFCFRFLVFF